MNSIQKIALAIVGVAAITALLLPGRNSAGVINAIGGTFSSSLGTAISGNAPKAA